MSTPDPENLAEMDLRLVRRLIRKGQLSEKDYERALKSLADVAEEAAPVEAVLEPVHISRAPAVEVPAPVEPE